MAELAIKIRIAEREYPMRVAAEEEARIRQAGRQLNERIKVFREQFALQDLDLLAMIAIEAVADRLLAEEKLAAGDSGLHQRLDHLHELLLTVPTGPVGGAGATPVSASVSGNVSLSPSPPAAAS